MQIYCSTCSFWMQWTHSTWSLNSTYYPHWLVQWSHHCSGMCIPVHCPWLPSYINVVQTVLVMLTIVGIFLDRPHLYGLYGVYSGSSKINSSLMFRILKWGYLSSVIMDLLKIFQYNSVMLNEMILHRLNYQLSSQATKMSNSFILKVLLITPWLVWLSGLSAGLWTKGSLVQFPVRVAGQVPSRGHSRGNHTLMFLSLSFSLPSPL